MTGGDGDALTIDTDYIDMQALFLNKWRLKTGIGYTKYTLPMALHSFYANEGDTAISKDDFNSTTDVSPNYCQTTETLTTSFYGYNTGDLFNVVDMLALQ